MKILILSSLTFFISLNSFGRMGSSFRKGRPFEALFYVKKRLYQKKMLSKKERSLINSIVEKTSVFLLLDVPMANLRFHSTSSAIQYAYAKKLFLRKKNQEAQKVFDKVRSSSVFYLSSLYHSAAISEIIGNYKLAARKIRKCQKSSFTKLRLDPIGNTRLQKDKYERIQELCSLLNARMLYKRGKFKRASVAFDRIRPEMQLFPSALFESSWPFFMMRQYPRSIGKTITFEAPFFKDYFFPEAELVKSLSYWSLCRGPDVVRVSKNFQDRVIKYADAFMVKYKLRSVSRLPYLKLLTDKGNSEKNLIANLLNVLRLDSNFASVMYYYKNFSKEYHQNKAKNNKAYSELLVDMTAFMNKLVRYYLSRYAKKIIRIGNILTEIELDVYSKMKEKLYSGKTKKRRKKFRVSQVSRKTDQYFWDFDGEFWADELGSYIPDLKAGCIKKVSSK